MNKKENSPFTPGSPVPVELFVGRYDQIEETYKYVKQSSNGKQENIFLLGDRGIGKSSLSSFIRNIAINEEKFLGIHVFLGGVNTLEEMVRLIFDELLKQTHGQVWFNNIANFFGTHIEKIGLFGVTVGFTPNKNYLKQLANRFPEALFNVLDN